VDLPLPWERLLWDGRPFRLSRLLARERYFLTDFRLARSAGTTVDELVLHDIGDVQRTESGLDRLLGTSTLIVRPRHRGGRPIVLHGIRRGTQVAALIEFLSGDPGAHIDSDAARAALAWTPDIAVSAYRQALAAIFALMAVMFAVVIGLNGKTTPIIETCHGQNAADHGWQMPGVAALPQSDVIERGWEIYGTMDTQMRNAIYGYLAEADKQVRAAYMREVVMPGMAALLRRPSYDFAKPYDYNRSHHALGCYHCHRVK
jgi:hypothetical protein